MNAAAFKDQHKLKIEGSKTYVGKNNKEFSILGYFLQRSKGLQVARKTLKTCDYRKSQLNQQGALKSRAGKYVRHFKSVNWKKDRKRKMRKILLGLCAIGLLGVLGCRDSGSQISGGGVVTSFAPNIPDNCRNQQYSFPNAMKTCFSSPSCCQGFCKGKGGCRRISLGEHLPTGKEADCCECNNNVTVPIVDFVQDQCRQQE